MPAAERRELAELLAAADSSRRLRLWPALRVAVAARRRRLAAHSTEEAVPTNR